VALMGVPSHCFELLIYLRGGCGMQTRQYQTIGTAMEAVRSLRPTQCYGWRLSLVLDAHSYPRESRPAAEQPRGVFDETER
jgi:hypothetical protein